MTTNEFNDKVLRMFTEEITDQVFLYIQNNDDLMNDYLDVISAHTRKEVNCSLGKEIKNRFNLQNDEKGEPKSVLIKTNYTKHI